MSQLYFIPHWFFGYDIALEVLFALVTLGVAFYSLYIFKLSAERGCKVFGLAFISISLSYFLWAGVNFFIVSRLADSSRTLSLDNLSAIGFIGVYGHMLLLLLGWATLAYSTLNTKGYRAYSLFVSLPLILLIFSAHKAVSFYFTSSLLILYVIFHYVAEYKQTGKITTFLVLLAFIFLFLGNLDFTFASVQHVTYVIGHAFHFIAYMLILASLVKTVRP